MAPTYPGETKSASAICVREVSLDGKAYSLLAFGGQGSAHAGGFTKNKVDIHDGRALIILKKTGEGTSVLRVSGTGLRTAELEI